MYVLDEPDRPATEDIRKLLPVLQSLADKGNTVIVIEHNLDVIKSADWIIDMGPEGDAGGGMVVAEGTPEQVATVEESFTDQYLAEVLAKEAQRMPLSRKEPPRMSLMLPAYGLYGRLPLALLGSPAGNCPHGRGGSLTLEARGTLGRVQPRLRLVLQVCRRPGQPEPVRARPGGGPSRVAAGHGHRDLCGRRCMRDHVAVYAMEW